MAANYNPYPSPTGGRGPYGMVPGPIGIPNPYADLANVFPALPQANKLAGTDVLAELGGTITPGTRNALTLAAAQRGQGRGMPLAGMTDQDLFGNIVGFSEGQVKQGMQDYNSLIPTISKTQTVTPELQSEIAARNALYAAAPDPTAANNLAQRLFDQYLNSMRGPGGGSSGGPQQGAGAFRPTFANNPATGAPNTPSGGSSPYSPTGDFSYNPFTGGAGGGTDMFGLLPDYTNPFGIGNVGEAGGVVGGGGVGLPPGGPESPYAPSNAPYSPGGGAGYLPDYTNPFGIGDAGGGTAPTVPFDQSYYDAVLGGF